MNKSLVYSWRVSPETKHSLEQEAHRKHLSVAGLLDEIVSDWLSRNPSTSDYEEVQRRLHEKARACLGTLELDVDDLSENTGERVRKIINEKYAAKRAD